MSDPNDSKEKTLITDLHMGNAPRIVAHMLKKPSCIVITRDEDGVVSMAGHGTNHAVANEMLSVSMYINLDQHYNQIRIGSAGAEAREQQEEVDQLNKSGVQS